MRPQGNQEILADDIMLAAGARHAINDATDIFMPDFALEFSGQIIFSAGRGSMFNCLHGPIIAQTQNLTSGNVGPIAAACSTAYAP
jgi:hypothetical protein